MEDKLVSLDEVLEKVSTIYREKRSLACELQTELFGISDRLKSESTTIKHIDYLNLNRKLDYLQKEIAIQNYIADGIELAREELFKFLYEKEE